MSVRLTEITRDNWSECIDLAVSDSQTEFVAANYESILLAKFEDNCYPMCIHDDDIMVGFLMYDIDPDTQRWELSRLMIDKKYQGKGYGKKALLILLSRLNEMLGSIDFYTSIVPANTAMKKLIESLGFSKTGEIMWEEEVFLKKL